MNPKDSTNPDATNGVRSRWKDLKPSYRAAIAIAVVALAWMASGVLSNNSVPQTATTTSQALTRVQVAVSHAAMHTRTVVLYGRIKAGNGVALRSKFDAIVVELVATKGNAVKKGDILVRFDAEGRAERVDEAKAHLEQAEIAYDAAKTLGKEGFRSKLNTAGAKADLQAARAGLALAKSNFSNTQIRAPFDGIVDDIPVEVGDLVSKGKMAAHVIDLTFVKVAAEVAERDAVNVSLGGRAVVNLMDGRSFEGEVTYVSRASNAQTRTYPVEVTLQTPERSIAEGVTAELRLPMQTENAHRVSPAILTLNDQGELGIKAVDDDGMVVFHAVEMVSDTRDGIWISGLAPKINVIVVGQEFVRPGQKVEAMAMPVSGAAGQGGGK